jgi:hypothetical protein
VNALVIAHGDLLAPIRPFARVSIAHSDHVTPDEAFELPSIAAGDMDGLPSAKYPEGMHEEANQVGSDRC